MSEIEHNDPINAQILAISEDKIQGFVREPFIEIAARSGVPLETVIGRIRTMLAAGTIRRVRQTLVASNLANGALVAWKVSEEKLNGAFDFMFQKDPFSGHVVIRSTDQQTAGSEYRLWTTLKTPVGASHGRALPRAHAAHRRGGVQAHARQGDLRSGRRAMCGGRRSSRETGLLLRRKC